MASQEPTPSAPLAYTQLTQIVVPLDQADQAFAVRDTTGRIPIVVVPARSTRKPLAGLMLERNGAGRH